MRKLMMRTLLLSLVASAALAPSLLAQAPAPPDGEQPVATVGSKTITFGHLRDTVVSQRRRAIAEKRMDAFTPAAVDQTIDGLVDVKLFALSALDRAVDRRPEVARRLEAIVDEALAQIALEDIIRETPLTDAALGAYFAAHGDAFRTAARRHGRQIIVATREEAEAALAEIRAGADFAAVASRRNIDATKTRGGDLGWLAKGTLIPAFEEAMFSLSAGQTSDVFQSSFGFQLVHVDEVDAGTVPAFDTVKDQVRRAVIDERVSAIRRELLAKYPVTIKRTLVDTLK
jgi:peptidyl-prolyl cis-trans isomerase C